MAETTPDEEMTRDQHRGDPVQPAQGGPPLRAPRRARREREPHRRGVCARRRGSRGLLGRAGRATGLERKWDRVLDWDDPPFAKWFVGGRLNASYNCVDRHVEAGRGDRVAINWVGEPEGDTRTLTYADLKDEVSRAANALTELGVSRGPGRDLHADDPRDGRRDAGMRPDRRPATVVFGGFSADALAARLVDCEARTIITADGGYRRGAASALKPAVDEAARRPPRRAWTCRPWSSYAVPARTSPGTTG